MIRPAGLKAIETVAPGLDMATRMSSQLLMFGGHVPEGGETTHGALPFTRAGHIGRMNHKLLQMCVLGSGSGGNCTVVRMGSCAILIDAGFGPNTTRRHLGAAKVRLQDVRAVVLTHLDRDHFRPNWLPALYENKIDLYVHRGHVGGLERLADVALLRRAKLLHLFDKAPFDLPISAARMMPLHLAHDTKGTFGFRLQTPGGSIGYATDLGHVPAELIDCFAGVNILAIESNYDPKMQQASSRPLFLKRRVMGMAGHLSNQEAYAAVLRIADRGPIGAIQHLVLLHRSRQCNHERIIRRVFEQDPRLAKRLTLTHQRRRTRWLSVRPLKPLARDQMKLIFSN